MPIAEALAVALGDALRRHRLRVATAESCTGGLAAGAITSVAGSSEWFERGFVTYSNEAKHEMLGVPKPLIETRGAVSEAVAAAMAEGALARSRVDCALSVTGVAGPGGGTPAKPVGMVCFGWAVRDRPTVVETHHFSGDRDEVRVASVEVALGRLIALVEGRDAPP